MIQAILNHVRGPWLDIDGTGGSLSLVGDVLVVRQNRASLEIVAGTIETLQAFARGELKHGSREVLGDESVRAENARIQTALKSLAKCDFEDRPLSEVLRALAETMKVPLWIDEESLADDGVALDESITLQLDGVSHASALKLILSPHALVYTVKGGLLSVTSQTDAEEFMTPAVYDLRDFAGPAAPRDEEIVDMVMTQAGGVWLDVDGTGGSVSMPVAGLLLVRQTQPIHEAVELLLNDMRSRLNEVVRENPRPAAAPVDANALVTRFVRIDILAEPKDIVGAVTKLVEPASWEKNGGEGAIELLDNILIVKNTPKVHRQLQTFLRSLREAGDPTTQQTFPGGGFGSGFGAMGSGIF